MSVRAWSFTIGSFFVLFGLSMLVKAVFRIEIPFSIFIGIFLIFIGIRIIFRRLNDDKICGGRK